MDDDARKQELITDFQRLIDEQITLNERMAAIAAELNARPMPDPNGAIIRIGLQQQNVLRALLRSGMQPADILRTFHTGGWTLSDLQALRASEDMKDE